MMCRYKLLILITCLLLATTGCRNRYGSCNNWLTCDSTVAPPPTYSLNIPSVARNQQPYYTPGAGTPSHTVDTSRQAPTPAGGTNPTGWRASGPNTTNANGDNASTAPTTFVQNGSAPGRSVLQGGPNTRTASNLPLPGTGVSQTNSTNYNTTSVDERLDQTRLAVTDASNVRAPSRTYPTTGQVVATPGIQQTYAGQAGFYRQTNPAYSASAVLTASQPIPRSYTGQPVIVNPGSYPMGAYPGQPVSYSNGAPVVVAESTASSVGSRGQLGWRGRELSSDRTERY